MDGGSDELETAPSLPLSGNSLPATPPVPSELPIIAQRSTNHRRSSGGRFRIRHALPLIFAGILLNSLNREKIMGDISGQLHETYNYYMPTTSIQPTQLYPIAENRTEDTAIIITSSHIPSHPSTYMIETVVNSTKQLIGLSGTAPIVITIDYFRFTHFDGKSQAMQNNVDMLEQYSDRLYHLYMGDSRIYIVPGLKHLHIGGSVMKAMNLVHKHWPSIKYVYYLQHDFYFTKPIDHKALVGEMDRNDKINYIRFPKRHAGISKSCGDAQQVFYNRTTILENRTEQLVLYPTSDYSDNNHLVRLKWNMDVIASLIKLNRAPEDPLQSRANNGCRNVGRPDDIHGLYLYHEMCIGHLDGRFTVSTP